MSKDINSKRLRLRRITEDDYDLIRHLDVDPKVKEFIGPPSEKAVTDLRMKKIASRNNDDSGLGYWMGEELETGKAIGWFVLNNLDETDKIEIGYRLVEKYWGNGYATEGATVLLAYGFNELDLKEVCGVTHLENEASKKVLKKIGLQERGVRFYYKQDVSYFDISKTVYLDGKEN